jgi:hypothetical protein
MKHWVPRLISLSHEWATQTDLTHTMVDSSLEKRGNKDQAQGYTPPTLIPTPRYFPPASNGANFQKL